MADEGATLYYISKQSFDFYKACDYLANFGLQIKNPETQMITGIGLQNDIIENEPKKIKSIIDNKVHLGINLWVNSKCYIFWSFLAKEDYFSHNFGFSSLTYLTIENITSKIFIEYALKELTEIDEEFLGFTIDQAGQTEYDAEFDSFLTKQNESLNHRDAPDLLFLPKHKMSQAISEDQLQIIELNQTFNCVAKDSKLLNFTKSLLSKK